MFRRKTLFVVGAGASAELGLPVGSMLTERIARAAVVRRDRYQSPTTPELEELTQLLIHKSAGDTQVFGKRVLALAQLSSGIHLKRSIDSYIDQHHDNPFIAEMGKLLIAYQILMAEQRSHLKLEANGAPDLRQNDVTKSWLDQFAAMLFEGLRADAVDDIGKNVDIVCFNYDRCIEHYLQYALVATYAVKLEEAARLVKRINIIHPYGKLGELEHVPFGALNAPLWKISENLKTFSESADSDVDDQAKEAVQRAERIVYLGFSFGRQNMDLLTCGPLDAKQMGRPSFASGFGLYDQQVGEIARQIEAVYGYRTRRQYSTATTAVEVNVKARQLLDMHWHNIMAG